MQDTYDPFSFLLSEISAFDAGERENWDPCQRQHYFDVLLADEAEEIAWGRRHLTVVHGRLTDDIEADLLDDLFAAWEEVAVSASWARIGGVPDQHLTLTIADDSSDLFSAAIDVSLRLNPGSWRVIEGAFP